VSAAPPPLRGVRVLDLTGTLGALCGKMLADLGADVVKVEPPGGSPLRRRGPFADGRRDPESSLSWWAHAAGCRSCVLDVDAPGGRERLLGLARAADILLESFPPGHLDRLGLGWPALQHENPRLILTSITPFGREAPYRGFQGPELVLQAMGGMMRLIGDGDRAPVRIGGAQAQLQAGGQAAVGTLVAHAQRQRSGRGSWVEVSAQHSMMWTMLSETGLPPFHGYDPFRDGPHVRAAGFRRRVIFPCRDGFVALAVGGGVIGAAMMRALTGWMDEEGMAPPFMLEQDWQAWDSAHLRSAGERGQAEIDLVTAAIAAFVAGKSKAELYEAALKRSLLLAPVVDLADLTRDAQLAARGFFASGLEPRLGREILRPGPFARLSRTPLLAPRPAPTTGEHTDEVLADWRERPDSDVGAPAHTGASADRRQPFEGLRVIDFAWVATGPISGRLLAEFGADVIRVESSLRMDPGRTLAPWAQATAGSDRSQFFANYNAGKRSITLDLGRPRAQELARQLVARADVVIESFTPGTMARWGLDYPSASAGRADLVYLSTCQQGQTGPHAHYRGYGSLAAALGGFYSVTGWPDRDPPMIYGAYTDFVAHHFASAALLAALDHRRRSGQGQHIDLSQLEASLQFLTPEILDYTVNARVPGRQGNRDEGAAPHGAYPCLGEDSWCAIACESAAQWEALSQLMGDPAWCREPRFASLAGRKAHEDELDRLISAFTMAREPWTLMRELQAAGVPAGVVQSCADLHRDPQLAAREALAWLDHPEMGRSPYEAWPFRILDCPGTLRPAPCLGADTEDVLGGILGLSATEIYRLKEEGILT
jgi:crotonobetainyl-CoA:carnitine CoA-transferase CaiB-like acyl-CoA transferase